MERIDERNGTVSVLICGNRWRQCDQIILIGQSSAGNLPETSDANKRATNAMIFILVDSVLLCSTG